MQSHKHTFVDALRYSLSDVEKLCDGRLFVTEKDVVDIADYFEISEDDLYRDYGRHNTQAKA